MNWYIGQDIVAVLDHFEGWFKKGDLFQIKGLRLSPCKCSTVDIDIGQIALSGIQCCECGYKESTTTMWHDEPCFAPLDSLADISELTELLENTKPFEITNK